MSDRTKTIFLKLVDVTECRLPFIIDDATAERFGVTKAGLKASVERLIELGVVRRERLPAGSFRRHGARTAYYLTGASLDEEGKRSPLTKLEPRVLRKIEPLDSWRSLTGMLLGDPPCGRSALDRPRRERRNTIDRVFGYRLGRRIEALRQREEADEAAETVAAILGGSVVA